MEFVGNIVDYVNNIVGESFIKTPWLVLLILLCFVLGLYLFTSFKLGNLSLKIEKEIVAQYDSLFYYLSMAKYKNEGMKDNLTLDVLQGILGTGVANYIPNRELITDKIKKIENSAGTKFIPDEEWSKLDGLYKKMKVRKSVSMLLKILLIIISVALGFLFICVLIWAK